MLGCSDKHFQVAREGRCEKLMHCPWNVVPSTLYCVWPHISMLARSADRLLLPHNTESMWTTCCTLMSFQMKFLVTSLQYEYIRQIFLAIGWCPWPSFKEFSFSWNSTILCFCQKLLNHVSPCVPTGKLSRQQLFFQHNQTKNSIYSSPQVILLCS